MDTLTDKYIRSLRPLGKDQFLADGGGLYLRVTIHGSKSFLYRSRKGGTTRYVTLGAFPSLSLAEARKLAQERRGETIGTLTLSYAATAFLASLDYKDPTQVERRLTTDILPDLGKKRLDTITSKDLSDTLQKIVDRGSPVAANRTLADVKHVFSFAFEKGWVRSNPAERITRRAVGGKEKSRDIVLTDDELKQLITLLRSSKWSPKTRAGLAVCLLTGQRASEVLGYEPQEVSGDLWTIPGTRTKNGKPQKVYLTITKRFLPYIEPCDHLTLSKALNRLKLRYTPHDLRRTMATRMSDMGVMPHIVEKCLNHSMTGVMAVYNKAEWLPERKDAWRKWYCYLRRLSVDF